MSNENDAAKLLVTVAKFIAPILELAPELERVGTLRGVEAGLNDRVTALQTEVGRLVLLRDDHTKQNTAAVQARAAQRSGVEAELDKLKSAADDHVKAQQHAAIIIVSAAKTEADDIVAKAHNDADKIADEARANVARIGVEITNSEERLATVNAEIAKREAALADLQKALAPALAR